MHHTSKGAFTSRIPSRSCHVRPLSAAVSLSGVVRDIQQDYMKKELPTIAVGDTVKVALSVAEGKDKKRTQTIEGTIISEQGTGINKTLTFRRIFQSVGIELTLPVHAPVVQSITLVKHGQVRRSKLYYLRDRVGKAARLKEVVGKAALKRDAAIASTSTEPTLAAAAVQAP
jgi:large subunit ribosomal protein L19